VGQFAVIRRDHRVDGLSIRALDDKHGLHRCTLRQALESAIPPARNTPQRVAPRLEPFKAAIDAMLRSDLDAPKKQRHTARRILARLVDEHGAVGLSYSTVRDHVCKRRPRILAEAGRPLDLGYVPQTHALPVKEGPLPGLCYATVGAGRTKPASCMPILIWAVWVVTTGSLAANARNFSSSSASTTPRPQEPVPSSTGPNITICPESINGCQ
jgi:hypothetical protein